MFANTAVNLTNLGDIHKAMGDMQKALDFFQKRAQLGRELFEANPKSEALKNGWPFPIQNSGRVIRSWAICRRPWISFKKISP